MLDSLTLKTPLTIALIGSTGLLVKCAARLIERGHHITCICSADDKVIEWASAHQISYTRTPTKFYSILSESPPEYLLSIVNPIILDRKILLTPSVCPINYHDSLLPNYAGSHATLWAIFRNEAMHGVTWHIMSEKVDAGSVLIQKKVKILSNDTISSLNVRCFNAALDTFSMLLAVLEKKSVFEYAVPIKKKLQFFSSYRRPTPLCVVDFQQTAQSIQRLFRALEYTHIDNIVGIPRILLPDGQVITARAIKVTKNRAKSFPGSIENHTKDYLEINTASTCIRLHDFYTLHGKRVRINHLIPDVDINNFCKNASKRKMMPPVNCIDIAEFNQYHKTSIKYEKFWVKRLQKSRPHQLSCLNGKNSIADNQRLIARFKPNDVQLKHIMAKLFQYDLVDSGVLLESIIIIFLLRINDYQPFSISMENTDLKFSLPYFKQFFSNYYPLYVNIYSGNSLLKYIRRIARIKQYLNERAIYYNDIFQRYHLLEKQFPFSNITIIHRNDLPKDDVISHSSICFLIKTDCSVDVYSNITSNTENEIYIRNIPLYLSELLKNLSKDIYRPIRSIDIVPTSEIDWQEKTIFSYRKLDKECLCSKMIDQIRRLKLHHALRIDDQLFTYEKLYARIKEITGYLRETTVAQWQVGAILLPLSFDLIASMLAISCGLGKTFVVVNPNHPMLYKSNIIKTSKASIIISTTQHLSQYKNSLEVVKINLAEKDKASEQRITHIFNHQKCSDPYIVFTSGSTGKPKGVRITSIGFKNIILEYIQRYYHANKSIRVACLTQYTFDAFILEVFASLLAGGTLHLVSDSIRYDPVALSNYLSFYSINTLVITPSLLRLIKPSPTKQMKTIICGGEQLDQGLVESCCINNYFQALSTIICCGEKFFQDLVCLWGRNKVFINAYGPSEVTVCTSMYRCRLNDTAPLIGKPMPNLQTYVLDKYHKLLPIGHIGELYICGLGLAREYVSDPYETQRSFPELNVTGSTRRYYKTGDFVKLHVDGNLEYLFRKDEQIKIRGYRVELSEIEQVISTHPLVKVCRVIAEQANQRTKKFKLAACIVKSNPKKNNEMVQSSVISHVSTQLPNYMRPHQYYILEKLPLSRHDKINIKELKKINRTLPEKKDSLLSFLSDKERLLASIFKSLFKKNVNDSLTDFFVLGGDSMTAMTLISILKSRGYSISLNDIFRLSTIKALAKQLNKIATTTPVLQHLSQSSDIPLSPIQRWFFERKFEHPNQWSQACFITLKKSKSLKEINDLLIKLLNRHAVFRLRFNKQWSASLTAETQTIMLKFHQVLDEKRCGDGEIIDGMMKAHRSINITQGPLLIGIVYGKNQHLINDMVLICHHLIIDAVSWSTILGELNCMIKENDDLPTKVDEYTFINWMIQSNKYPCGSFSPIRGKCLRYCIPSDFKMGVHTYDDMEYIALSLDEEKTMAVSYASYHTFKIKIHTILLYVLLEMLIKIYKLSTIAIDLELHGRDHSTPELPLNEAIGWFTSILPIKLSFHTNSTPGRIYELATHIRDMKQKYRITDLQVNSNLSLNYWGNWDFNFERENDVFSLDRIEILSAMKNTPPYHLSIEAYIKQKKLHLIWHYSKKHFKKETVQHLSNQWIHNLDNVLKKDLTLPTQNSNYLKRVKIDHQQYKLSDLQKGLFYTSKTMGTQDPYAVQVSIELIGKVDPKRIKSALKHLINLHPVLRTSLDYGGSVPALLVHHKVSPPFRWINLTHLSYVDAQQSLHEILVTDRLKVITLNRCPLLRFILVQCSDTSAYLIFTAHHIILDGMSLKFLMKRFLELYQERYALNHITPNECLIHQNYLNWLSKEKQQRSVICFWKDYLKEFSNPTLSGLINQTSVNRLKQINVIQWIDLKTVKRIHRFIQSKKLTLNIFMHAIFAIVLYRYTQEKDVVFGTVVTHRQAPIQGILESVGFYFNTVPLRYQFKEKDTFTRVLAHIKTDYLKLIENSVLDLNTIQSYTALPKQSELFHAMLIFEQHARIEEINLPSNKKNNLKIKSYAIDNPTHYPLSLSILSLDKIKLTLTQDLMKVNTIDGHTFLESMVNTIKACIHHIENSIDRYPLLPQSNIYHQCIQWNNSTQRLKNITVIDLIDRLASENGNKTAIIFDDKSINYKQLVEKSNTVAYYLLEQSLEARTPIAFYLDRGIPLVTFILGILKSGHVFVPFDPDTPILRTLDSLQKSNIKHLWISKVYYDKYKSILIQQNSVSIHCLADNNTFSSPISKHPLPKVTSEQLAYVLFTSGSTGHPKGVYIRHISLTNLVSGMQKILSASQKDYLLSFTPITFDISLLEIFLPLTIGATCVMTHTIKQQGVMSLKSEIKRNPITIMQTTPSAWSLLIDSGWSGSQHLTAICGGDKLSPVLASSLLKRCKKLLHVYGPTETTIWSTSTTITEKTLKEYGVQIGKPIQNNYVFILDEYYNFLPAGCKGYLYIGGCGVAQGYDKDKLTKSFFKKININRDIEMLKGKYPSKLYYLDKLYNTGDIAYWSNNGELNFIGRHDSQVKIRGFRVDLAEIEAILLRMPLIKQAIVLSQTFSAEDTKLVAYYVSKKRIDAEKLKKKLAIYLPYYMLPSHFIYFKTFPKTKHGKIDKQKLLLYKASSIPDRSIQLQLTAFQAKVKKIWINILHYESINPNDNFFNRGGHSLLVLKLFSELEFKLGIKAPLKLIIQHPRFIDFCNAIEKHTEEDANHIMTREIYFHGKKIPDPVVQLASGKSKQPLFLFHPIGGTIFWYIKLAEELKKLGISSIYAFQDPGILNKKNIFNDFKVMAQYYHDIICHIQPQGEYYLAGASSGANMAVEVAQLFFHEGQRTAFVGLFDGWAKYPEQLLKPDVFHSVMANQYNQFKQRFKKFSVNNADQLFNIQMQRQQLLFDYQLNSIPFAIHLYKSKQRLSMFKEIDDNSNYWRHYCENKLIIRTVPGNHETMFSNANVITLAKTIYHDLKKSTSYPFK